MEPLRIFIDMDDTLCDFQGAYQQAIKDNPGIQFPQSQIDFFRSLKPLHGAIDAMQWMLAQPHLDPHILTAPSIKNPACYMEKRLWVSDHLGDEWLDRLHISPRKDFFDGHILIDDCATGRGQDQFKGMHIHFGQDNFLNWSDVVEYLKNSLTTMTPAMTLDDLLNQTEQTSTALDDEDKVWLQDSTTKTNKGSKEASRRIEEYNDPVRYIIRSTLSEGNGLCSAVYWNLSDGSFSSSIENGTLFKDENHAQILADQERDLELEVVKVNIQVIDDHNHHVAESQD